MKMPKWAIKGLMWLVGGAAAIIAVLLIVLTVGEYKPQAVEEIDVVGEADARAICEGDRVEILTFNVGYAGLDAGMDSVLEGGKQNRPKTQDQVTANLDGMIEWIGRGAYDAVFLQEVDRDSRRSYYINEAEVFREALGGASMFAQNHRCLLDADPIWNATGRVDSGLQTLTGLKVRSAERVALPFAHDWPAQTGRLKSCLLVTRVPVEQSGRELVLINLQMNEKSGVNGIEEQMEALIELMQEEYALGNYVIAGGDFRQVFPDDDFSQYPIRSKDVFIPERMEKTMLDETWTFASDTSVPTKRLMDNVVDETRWWAQYYVIDGFILSPNVQMERVETLDGGFEFSDHNPVRLLARLLA